MSYEQAAPYYDAIYTSIKDYRAETERVRELIDAHAKRPVQRVLDVACGTGLHAQYLREHYDVAGLDLSPAQLQVARRRLPDMPLYEADMRDFSLVRPVDAIVCLFSAIGHLPSTAELEQTIANFARHLEPGGVILIEPWLMPHMWRPGFISMDVVDQPNLKIARIGRSSCNGNVTRLELEHLVAEPAGNKHFVEVMYTTMFTEAEFHAAFDLGGLVSRYDRAGINDNGRGIFTATKPQ